MICGFARIDIAAADPGAEADRWARFLGCGAAAGDLDLDNVALRIRAAEAEEPPGLARLVFAVEDLAAAVRTLERRGMPAVVADGEASTLAQGVRIGLAETPARPPHAGKPEAISALDHVVIRTSDAERAVATYGARLGLDFRLDRSNPAWGARLLFFRCGDAVVEISAAPDAARSEAPDRLSGLAFRTREPDLARARLAGAGFDVSEVRAGRKPGTRVFTVRSGLAGAPCLVLSSAPAADAA